MAKKVTRTEIKKARHPKCIWSEERIETAIAVRFPGTDEVELEALIASWLADKSLSRGTLGQCCNLAAKLAGDSARGLWLRPTKTLERILKGLRDGAPIPQVNRKKRRAARQAADLDARADAALARDQAARATTP